MTSDIFAGWMSTVIHSAFHQLLDLILKLIRKLESGAAEQLNPLYSQEL